MFIIDLSYIKPIEEVEKFLSEHVAFLEKYYATGNFIFSGRKNPRTGGIILCKGDSKQEIEKIMKQDPFYVHEIASYQLVEINITKYADAFSEFMS